MKTLKVMDSTGDTEVRFDETKLKDKATIEAQALFNRLTNKGAAVFAVNRPEGQPDKRVKAFSELEQDNIVVPRIVSG